MKGIAVVAGLGDPLAVERTADHADRHRRVDLVLTATGGAYLHTLGERWLEHRLPATRWTAAEWASAVVFPDASHLDALAHGEVVERLLERIHAVRPLERVEVITPGAGCLPRVPAGVEPVVLEGAAVACGNGVGDRIRARWESSTPDALESRGLANPVLPPPEEVPLRLGVVVLSYEGLPYTRRCIASLLASSPPDMRLVLVDNASTDGTADWARRVSRDDPRLIPVALSENRGVPGGRNAGLAALDLDAVDAVAFLDNDVEVGPGWWRPFAATLVAHPSAGVVGEEGYVVDATRSGTRVAPLPGRAPRVCDIVVGYCMIVRADALRSIGPFDEGLGLFWHDDDDYCLRAQIAGWSVVRQESGRVLHYGHASSAALAEIWQDAHAGVPSDLSDRNRRRVAAKLRAMTGQPPIAGVDGDFTLVVGLEEDALPAIARATKGRAVPVLAVPVHGRLDPPRLFQARLPTRSVPGGLVVTEPLPLADAAVLAGAAIVVVGGAGAPERIGGVEVLPLEVALTRLREGESHRLSIRPWRRAG